MSSKEASRAVSLPGGTVWFSVEGDPDVRQTALEWLDVVEVLARSSVPASAMRAWLAEASRATQAPAASLTPAEVAELEAAGARRATARSSRSARGERVTWQVSMLSTSLDVAEAAARLGVDPTRVRQRLREGSLYGLRVGRSWRLPLFQFAESGAELPHIGDVLRAMPRDLHPRSVAGFLDTPQPELRADGEAVSARAWLASGGRPAPIIALAGALAAE